MPSLHIFTDFTDTRLRGHKLARIKKTIVNRKSTIVNRKWINAAVWKDEEFYKS